jgi:hypothetical protein
MTGLDSLTFYTLNAMADDWESIVQIEPQVTELHGPVAREAIFDVLRRLHDAGHIRAMDQNGYSTDGYPADPHTAWFSMTDSGRALFDENFAYYRDSNLRFI